MNIDSLTDVLKYVFLSLLLAGGGMIKILVLKSAAFAFKTKKKTNPDILESPSFFFFVTGNKRQLCKHPKSTSSAYLNGY